MNDEYFTIPYIIDTIPNYSAGHRLPTQAKKNVWIIPINWEEPITDQGALNEINHHEKSMWEIQGQYQSMNNKDLTEDRYWRYFYIFDQARPVVSQIEVRLPKEALSPKNLG